MSLLKTSLLLPLLFCCSCRLPETPAVAHGLPQEAKRVVSVAPQIFEDIVSLGVTPVGAYRIYTDEALMPADVWKSIAPLTSPPNIEQVLSLHPDLIFSVATNNTDSLNRIAPTVNVKDFTNFSDWQVRYRSVAKALHREAEAETGILDTAQKVSQVRRDFRGHPFRILMGHVSANTRSMVVFTGDQNTAHLIESLGLTYGTLHNRKPTRRGGTTVSWESVDDLDCDAYFVTPSPFEERAEREQVAEQLAMLAKQPLWNRLPFVRKGRVFYMDGYWQMITPINADRVMEDLERLLLKRDLDAEWHLRLPVQNRSPRN